MSSIWFKMSNSKIAHLKFCRFFRQSVREIIGKTTIWTILCFSRLRSLNIVVEQWGRLTPGNVIDTQHCIGGDGEF